MRKQPTRRAPAASLRLLTAGLICLAGGLPPAPALAQQPDLGVGASLHGKAVFPAGSVWNTDISAAPVDPNSGTLIASMELTTSLHPDFGANYNGGPFGIPYVVVPGSQPPLPVNFQIADQSDPGPYPVPQNAPVEGGAAATGDRHVLVVDRDNWCLYEMYSSYPVGSSRRTSAWRA